MMRAIEIAEYGDASVLRLCNRPVPVPKDGEVLIRVKAAGVNRPDILQRMGYYPPPPGASDLPGLDIAGIREDTGEEVCALLPGGGYAEYCTAPESLCLSVPKGLDMVAAAALPECIFTVWNNLFIRGRLAKGETALIHGGASGIGTTAIQMAKAFGARVIITAGSDAKCQECLKIGADLAINYKKQDFVQEIEAFAGQDAVDVVLDMVGGDYITQNLKVLKLDGRHVSIAHLGGNRAEIPIRTLMTKRIIMTGSTLRARSLDEKTTLAKGILQHVWPKIENGSIQPVLFKTFPMEDAAEAHKALEKGDHIGKIVLRLD